MLSYAGLSTMHGKYGMFLLKEIDEKINEKINGKINEKINEKVEKR